MPKSEQAGDKALPGDHPGGFSRGNINFDILKPEPIVVVEPVPGAEAGETPRYSGKHSKRGMFDSGRKYNPIGFWQKLGWSAVCLVSASFLGFLFLGARSLLWLLALPFALVLLLWSLLMLVLFLARPR